MLLGVNRSSTRKGVRYNTRWLTSPFLVDVRLTRVLFIDGVELLIVG